MSIDQDIANSAKQLKADVKINHAITHGDDTTEVATEGGPVPSIRKRLKDIETEWSKTADPLADSLASTVQVTKDLKDAAAASATEAAQELPKVQAEGAKQVIEVVDQGTLSIEQIKTEGGKQVSLVRKTGDDKLADIQASGDTAEQAASEAQAIASKFGDVDSAITTATTQANRATSEADRAEAAANGVVTETEGKIKEIQAAGTVQANTVNTTGSQQVQRVTDTGTDQSQALATTAEAKKQEIDTAADGRIADINAAGGDIEAIVDDAQTIADQASTANQQAQTAASEAKAAEDNATAIVHNDEGSTTSKPGAYPVADSKGHLDIGWTPSLQAMYPYSGVIGSVDKGDLFLFSQISAFSNLFQIKQSRFNIAGRFVEVAPGNIILPESESTAERAIAFDDIFLDWNGSIQTYRSITPHRTTTGYDRDAIATEHGYSKIQTGLYKTGDTYALLLGRVARRNQGAYHPVFNPEGARWPLADLGTIQYWHQDRAIEPVNANEPFNISNSIDGSAGAGAYINSGAIDRNRPGRPDGKLYDAIYADDFTPLYYSAKNVIDRQALLFDSFNRAVAGETFSGAEGTKSDIQYVNQTDYTKSFRPRGDQVTVNSNSIVFTDSMGMTGFQCTGDKLCATGKPYLSILAQKASQ